MLGDSFQEQSSIPLVGEFGKGMMPETGVSASLGGFARPSCPRSVSGYSEIGRSEYTTALVRNPCTTPVNVPLPGMSPWDMSTARMALRSDSLCVVETLAGSFPTFRNNPALVSVSGHPSLSKAVLMASKFISSLSPIWFTDVVPADIVHVVESIVESSCMALRSDSLFERASPACWWLR
jgi:hypothetical protein